MSFKVLGIVLILASNFVASSARGATGVDLMKYPRSVSVTHYNEGDFSSFSRLIYNENEGATHFIPADHEFTAGNEIKCYAAFLRSQQNFSLGIQMKRNGVSFHDAQTEVELGLMLHNKQVAYFEVTRLIPDHLDAGVTHENDIDVLTPEREGTPGTIRRKTAAFWTIAGQIVEGNDTHIVPKDLLWQLEPGAAEVAAKYFDRTKYKFVSEWGRAGQLDETPGDVNPLYSAAAAEDYRRIKAINGNINDAYVMFSTAEEKLIRLYDKTYPGTRFPPGVPRDQLHMKETLFMVPLTKMLELYPPSRYYERVAQIKKITGLGETQALDIIEASKMETWNELSLRTIHHGQQQQRLIMADFSGGAKYSLITQFQRMGVPHEKWESLYAYLQRFNTTVKWEVENESPDFSHPSHNPTLADLNTVDISNLEPGIAEEDPNFVETALLGGYSFYVKKHFGLTLKEAPPNEVVHQYLQTLISNHQHFSITSANPEVVKQALALSPSQIVPATVNTAQGPKLGFTFLFTVEQLGHLIDEDPAFFHKYCDSAVIPGIYRAKNLLRSNDPF